MSLASVLVVDDDAIVRKMLTRRLELDDYRVVAADGGVAALAALETEAVDIVLLDVLMPEMDGYEVLEQIRASEAHRHLPVVVISGLDDLSAAVRCIELGADDYLNKPVDPVLLRARMSSGLVRKRLHDMQQDYLRQVGVVAAAAGTVEDGTYEPGSLDQVSEREDALGRLARVFAKMAVEVRAREDALVQQVQQLKIEIDKSRTDREVDEIVETDFFRDLSSRARDLRAR
jgi:response regulator RpfG family c-di-GMP phosphodiesterase